MAEKLSFKTTFFGPIAQFLGHNSPLVLDTEKNESRGTNRLYRQSFGMLRIFKDGIVF